MFFVAIIVSTIWVWFDAQVAFSAWFVVVAMQIITPNLDGLSFVSSDLVYS